MRESLREAARTMPTATRLPSPGQVGAPPPTRSAGAGVGAAPGAGPGATLSMERPAQRPGARRPLGAGAASSEHPSAANENPEPGATSSGLASQRDRQTAADLMRKRREERKSEADASLTDRRGDTHCLTDRRTVAAETMQALRDRRRDVTAQGPDGAEAAASYRQSHGDERRSVAAETMQALKNKRRDVEAKSLVA